MADKRFQFPVQRQGTVNGSLLDERRPLRTVARDVNMRIVSVGKHGRASAAAVSGNVPSLSSFGVDGNGELYAVSLGGTLYKLR